MQALTLNNIPDELYLKLEKSAQIHHRSLDGEILYCVERALGTHKIDVAEHLITARHIREKTSAYPANDAMLDAAKNSGRP